MTRLRLAQPVRPLAVGVPFVVLVSAVAILTAGCLGGFGGGRSETFPLSGAPSPAAPSTASAAPSAASGACPTSQPAPLPAGQKRTLTIDTPKGTIAVEIDGALSPIAAGNVVALAACGWYDGVVFHRVVTGFVIQGGDGQYGRLGPDGTLANPALVGRGGPGYTIQDEPVTATYGRGVVAMARSSGPNSVGSQFFIVLDDAAAASLAAPQYNNYQIVGLVSSGMDVVDAIAAAADAEIPSHPVVMTKVTVSQ